MIAFAFDRTSETTYDLIVGPKALSHLIVGVLGHHRLLTALC